jgi:hypothetical protein
VAISPTTPLPALTERLYPLGYPVNVATNDPHIAALVKTLWGDWQQLVAGEPLKVSIQRTSPALRGKRRERFQATAAGFRLDSAASSTFDAASLHLQIRTPDLYPEHFLQTAILTALDFSLFTPVHAACVVQNGNGIILCGDSGSGKSTLAYACARRGWTLVSDESVHLVPGLGSTVASFSSTIRLREPARALFAELQHERLGIAPNGKTAMEIRSAERGFRTTRTTSVEHVLFLSRRPGPPELSELDLNVAEQYFFKYLWQPGLQTHQQRLQDLAIHAGIARFAYEHVDDAVDALEDLLKEKGMAA